MAKYQASYKCQLCGTTIHYGEPWETPSDVLPALCESIIEKQLTSRNPRFCRYPLMIPHECPNEIGCGIAHFIGFHKLSDLHRTPNHP